MRSYRRNSPEAAARIVAWTILVDATQTDAEAAACAALPAALGITADGWNDVVRGLCEDLLATGAPDWDRAVRADSATFIALLDELDDPALRRRVLSMCRTIAAADGRLCDRERVAVETVSRAWQGVDDARPAGPPP
jgi:hypothetical protein